MDVAPLTLYQPPPAAVCPSTDSTVPWAAIPMGAADLDGPERTFSPIGESTVLVPAGTEAVLPGPGALVVALVAVVVVLPPTDVATGAAVVLEVELRCAPVLVVAPVLLVPAGAPPPPPHEASTVPSRTIERAPKARAGVARRAPMPIG